MGKTSFVDPVVIHDLKASSVFVEGSSSPGVVVVCVVTSFVAVTGDNVSKPFFSWL